MSSLDEDFAESQPKAPKKRKVLQRACDYCRRKKIKCDGPRMPNKRCSKCISRRAECTYVEPFNKPRYPDSYVENLESRLRRMEELLQKLNPDADILKTLDTEPGPSRTPSENAPSPAIASGSTSLRPPKPAISASSPELGGDEDEFSDEDAVMRKEIIAGLTRLSLQPEGLRYHGKSSGWVLIQATEGFRQEYIRETSPGAPRPTLADLSRVSDQRHKRQPWIERPIQDPLLPPEDFPPKDLMNDLVNLYFRHINNFVPLLHQPTFLQCIEDKLHLRVSGFGATVLLVCALGSRYSQDPRVLLDGTDSWNSAGWKWFQTVDNMHKSLRAPASVYDLQIAALWTIYMQSTTVPQCNWVMIGLGLRKAMDAGAHRKTMYRPKVTVEDELWRRAFWSLLVLEWWTCYGLGRPPCIHEEEYDLALPTECDDEFWTSDDPEKDFKQPPGKPSQIAFWNCFIQISRIIPYATRTIYSIRKSRAQMGNTDSQWEARVVAELDSELNRWMDTVPEHLKWNPDCENELFLTQSATLFAVYYQVQITIHRTFITSRRGSTHSLASLIICTNAARSNVQILDRLRRRIGTPGSRNAGALFLSGLVLCISMWGQKKSGRTLSADRDREYVEKCIEMLYSIEREYNIAPRLGDMLKNFLTVEMRPAYAYGHTEAVMDTQSGQAAGSEARVAPPGSNTSAPTKPPATHPASASASPQGPTSSTHDSDAHRVSGPSLPTQYPSGSSAGPLRESFPRPWQSSQGGSSSPFMQQSTFGFHFPLTDAGGQSQPWDIDHSGSNFVGSSNSAPQQVQGGAPGTAPYNPSDMSYDPAFSLDMLGFGGPADGVGEVGEVELPDCAFLDDAMTIWSNAPASFGLQDWEAYFNTVNGAQQSGN